MEEPRGETQTEEPSTPEVEDDTNADKEEPEVIETEETSESTELSHEVSTVDGVVNVQLPTDTSDISANNAIVKCVVDDTGTVTVTGKASITEKRPKKLEKAIAKLHKKLSKAIDDNKHSRIVMLEARLADLDKYKLTDDFIGSVLDNGAILNAEGVVTGYHSPIMRAKGIRCETAVGESIPVVSCDGSVASWIVPNDALKNGLKDLVEQRRETVRNSPAIQSTLKAVYGNENVVHADLPKKFKWDERDGAMSASWTQEHSCEDMETLYLELEEQGKLSPAGMLALGG
jgi:hypothetical protein